MEEVGAGLREVARHQIGAVADRVGLSHRTVRLYEEVGLVTPSGRTPGGFRLYTEEDVARLEFVKQMKPLDFSLEELKEIMSIRDRLSASEDAEGSQQERGTLIARLAAYVDVAEARREALRQRLTAADLVTARLRAEVEQRTRERGH